jgi:hypothetical protein
MTMPPVKVTAVDEPSVQESQFSLMAFTLQVEIGAKGLQKRISKMGQGHVTRNNTDALNHDELSVVFFTWP